MYVKRDLEDEIKRYIDTKEIIAVVGTRQCGKTTMLVNMLDKLRKKGKKVNMISFENVKELNLFEKDIDSFIDLHVKGFDILFIDELQYSKDSGKKLKYIFDNHDTKVFISGSSAAELSIQSLRYLVGRIFIFALYPFSFKEFLRVKAPRMLGVYEKPSYKQHVTEELNKHLKEFMLFGGYPRVVLSRDDKERMTVLRNIFNTYLLKEIREILTLSQDFKLVNLIKALSLQIGNMLNYNELSTITGFSYKDLKKYLNILEKTYICYLARPFHTNKRTELAKSPKIYFFDLGFRNIAIENFSGERTDMGIMYENFIFSELIKSSFIPKYWRTKSGAEVDFVLEIDNDLIPVEVKSSLSEKKVTKSFHSFIEKYKPRTGYICSLSFEDKKKVLGSEVKFVPILKLIGILSEQS